MHKRACHVVATWHAQMQPGALGTGVAQALWRGHVTDAMLLACAVQARQSLDAPFALIDRCCTAPAAALLPAHGPAALPGPRGFWHGPSLVGLSAGLSIKFGLLCAQTCLWLCVSGLRYASGLWASWRSDALLGATPEAGARGVGAAHLPVLPWLAAWVGLERPRAAPLPGSAHQALLQRMAGVDVAAWAAYLARLCAHPDAAWQLVRLAEACRAPLVPTSGLQAVMQLLRQAGVDMPLQHAMLTWAAEGLTRVACGLAECSHGSDAATWLGPWLQSVFTHIAAGDAPGDPQWMKTHLEALLTRCHLGDGTRPDADASFGLWCARGTALVAQCREVLSARIEAEGHLWAQQIAALQTVCPPAVWQAVGRMIGRALQETGRRKAKVPCAQDTASTFADADAQGAKAYLEALGIPALPHDLIAPACRTVAESMGLVMQVSRMGQMLLSAVPLEAPWAPWNLMWAGARSVLGPYVLAQPDGASDATSAVPHAEAVAEPAVAPPRPFAQGAAWQQGLQSVVQDKADSLAGMLWPPVATVSRKQDVDAYYLALRSVHAAFVTQDGAPTRAPQTTASAHLAAAAALCVALGAVFTQRTQFITVPYRTSGRLNMRRFVAAQFRPDPNSAQATTYFDQRERRCVRARALHFGVLAQGGLSWTGQSPWDTFGDAVTGLRRLAPGWRDVGHLFVVLDALFTGQEAEHWDGAQLLAPLRPRLRIRESDGDSWTDLRHNLPPRPLRTKLLPHVPARGAGACLMPGAATASDAIATLVQQAKQPKRVAGVRPGLPAHEVAVILVTPAQAQDAVAHLHKLHAAHPYFVGVVVIMGDALMCPAHVRDACVVLTSPEGDLAEIAVHIARAYESLQAGDDDWQPHVTPEAHGYEL